ncbi:RNA-directed DNA polymerase, eukaryota [Tanacetum coccineum]|uniref:RNA-directed DNA polymerase, eukaryota n=1 Tax=Tanacetum coccineum TaxID=301880 RepID=A0ABQ5ADD6_9ASTR
MLFLIYKTVVNTRHVTLKAKTLSIGGRLTLLKSVLGASPIYNLSIFKAPVGILKDMERIRSNFFKGADLSDRKISWVAWDKALASKKSGGLGISSYFALNRALLLKWVWRFISQDGSLWFRVIQSLYGSNLDLHSVQIPSIWSSILREVNVLNSKGFNFVSHCKIRIGDGCCTRFWYDSWTSEQPLCIMFPRIFALESTKDSTVECKFGLPSVDVSFRRPVRDGVERKQWNDLCEILDHVILSSSKDRWYCDLSGDGEFRVKEVRSCLDNILLPSSDVPTRWVSLIPIKINIFAWRARLDRLPTRSNLACRGIVMDSVLCPICGSDTETISHILFRCNLGVHIFRKICRWWEVDWLDVSSFDDWLEWFSAIRLSSKVKLLMEGVCMVAWWHIWAYRNKLLFDDSPPRQATLFDDIVSRSYFWCVNRCIASFSWETWLKKPYSDLLVMFLF